MSDFGKGIPLASGFDLGAKKPLDSRSVVETIEERNEHVVKNRAYEGMIVYVKENEKLYKYNGYDWIDLNNYYSKEEIDNMVKNLDIDTESCAYVGETMPEDDKIWFSDGVSSAGDGIIYDNPLIQELFACINTLQSQIKKLQEEVDYLKLHGGGTGGDSDTPGEDTIDEDCLVLEDGSMLLLEDGGNFLLETSNIITNAFLLENGFELLLEDGSNLLLETENDKNTDAIVGESTVCNDSILKSA